MVIVIGEPRRKLLCDLQPWSGRVRDAHDIGAVYPSDSEIMLVDMRK